MTPDQNRALDYEAAIFAWLSRKYVQRADARQEAMGLQYTTAETHDLAKGLAALIARAEGRPSPEGEKRHADDCQSHIVDVRGVPDECTCGVDGPALSTPSPERAEGATAGEADIPSILERAVVGDRLSASEQSALTGYEIGWRDGRNEALSQPSQAGKEDQRDIVLAILLRHGEFAATNGENFNNAATCANEIIDALSPSSAPEQFAENANCPPAPAAWKCGAIANPEDCGWPFCGCDPAADKVLAAIQEHDMSIVPNTPAPAAEPVERLRKGLEARRVVVAGAADPVVAALVMIDHLLAEREGNPLAKPDACLASPPRDLGVNKADREEIARDVFRVLHPHENWNDFDDRYEARGGYHSMQLQALEVTDAILAKLSPGEEG